ncbi:nuclear transport factor 2 family protein [Chloroflexota bacterium]
MNQASLQVLLDKQEIYELLMRYCRAIDRCDEPLLRSVYHPDATDDHGGFKGKVPELYDWLSTTLSGMKLTTHNICNVLIEVEGDVAYGEAYFLAYHRIPGKEKDYDMLVGGRYIDRFERRDGVWKIAERRCVFDWNRNDPCTESRWPDGLLTGCRGPEDQVYQR